MTASRPALWVLDDVDPVRSRALARRLAEACPHALVEHVAELRLPEASTPPPGPMVLLVHWDSSGGHSPRAREIRVLLRQLVESSPGADRHGVSMTVIPFSGGGAPVLDAELPGLVLGDHPPFIQPVDGPPIPIVPLQAALLAGDEVAVEALGEAVAWCIRGERSAPLPVALRPPPPWRPVAVLLLQGYLAACDPDGLGLAEDLRERSSAFASTVGRTRWWRPLALALDPGSPQATVGEVFACLAGRVRQELGAELDPEARWHTPPSTPRELEARVRRALDVLSGMASGARAT